MADRVLLVHVDEPAQDAVTRACAEIGADVRCVEDAGAAGAHLETNAADLVLCDFDTFTALRSAHPHLCAVLLVDRAYSDQAIEWMKGGALDYVIKPLQHGALTRAIADALLVSRDIELPVYDESADHAPPERIVGQSPAMQEVYKLIGRIAPREVNVLIGGESGTGKDLVARALYQHSPRKDRLFLAVNCAAIPETLLESELFGHEKGAFTGADTRRIGKFEQCDGGTLFLDEIGDIPLATQAKLLRVLQDHTFQRLGGTEVVQCDVRILAASNQPLERMIVEKRFREDLYYRIKVASIDLPALRDREVDAVLLAHYFVRRFNRQLQTQIKRLAPETLPYLLTYDWPGNVRELENVVKAALVVARGTVFRPEFLPAKVREARPGPKPAAPTADSAGATDTFDLRALAESLADNVRLGGNLYREAVAMMEREIIRACLERTRGQIAPAAKRLGVSRTTLRKKITQLGLNIETQVRATPNQ